MIFNSMLLPQRKQSCDKITILEKQGEIIGGMSEQGGLVLAFYLDAFHSHTPVDIQKLSLYFLSLSSHSHIQLHWLDRRLLQRFLVFNCTSVY